MSQQTAEQGAALANAELAARPDTEARLEYIADELSITGKERAREITEGATEDYHQGFEAALREASITHSLDLIDDDELFN